MARRLTCIRGDKFERVATLGNSWTDANIAEARFTVRASVPASASADDSDALAQVTLTGGGIAISGTTVTITINPAVTRLFPLQTLFWDLQITGVGDVTAVYTPDSGTLVVRGDVTQAQP